jgi:hypothetical protein
MRKLYKRVNEYKLFDSRVRNVVARRGLQRNCWIRKTSDVLDPARHLSGQEDNAKQQPGIRQKAWNALGMNNVPAIPSLQDYVQASGQQGKHLAVRGGGGAIRTYAFRRLVEP